MSIKGISEVRRLRRLGRIRLGEKRKNQSGKEYPAALDYFNIKDVPELIEILGDKPREIEVMLPNERVDAFFPQERKAYRATGLFCRGDGEVACRVNVGISDGKNNAKVPAGQAMDPDGSSYIKKQGLDVPIGAMFEMPCLGEECPFTIQKFCKPIGRFLFLIPKAPRVGCYEISTTSWNSIVELNSSIDTIRSLAGRISMIPLKLKLIPREVQVEGKRKTIHHLVLEYQGSLSDLMRFREAKEIPLDQLPSPQELDHEIPEDLVPHGGESLEEHIGSEPPSSEPAPAAVYSDQVEYTPVEKLKEAIQKVPDPVAPPKPQPRRSLFK